MCGIAESHISGSNYHEISLVATEEIMFVEIKFSDLGITLESWQDKNYQINAKCDILCNDFHCKLLII